MLDLFTNKDDLSNPLYIRVTANASKNTIKVEHNKDGSKSIKVYVTAQAENNKANEAVINLLATQLGIAKSLLKITHGHKSKNKIITILNK